MYLYRYLYQNMNIFYFSSLVMTFIFCYISVTQSERLLCLTNINKLFGKEFQIFVTYLLNYRRMSTEDNSSDGMTSVSTASLVVEHMPLSISQLTENSQTEGVMPSDGVLTIAVDANSSVLQESFSGRQ